MNLHEWDTKASKLMRDIVEEEKRSALYEIDSTYYLTNDHSVNYTEEDETKIRTKRAEFAPVMIRDDIVALYSQVSSLNEQLFYLSEKKTWFGWIHTIIALAILLVLVDMQYGVF